MKTAIVSLFCLLLIASSSYAQPAISFSQPDFDFVTVGQEDHIEHVFEFANTGDQDLVIDKVHAS